MEHITGNITPMVKCSTPKAQDHTLNDKLFTTHSQIALHVWSWHLYLEDTTMLYLSIILEITPIPPKALVSDWPATAFLSLNSCIFTLVNYPITPCLNIIGQIRLSA